ncbi:Threonine/homoserine efflux transporter RhtA [Agromyces sp. CF514]|uniref:DMT family transporter n=1 Tax=Agromyces sp. CF514 TaxID=1881031 RepID=UPI0008E1675A|nr:DMT family transporter [Agromyces sp. CF514]SFR74943.1 Threonine/homoserine efflux transporter RhtA [Agromyces sp. CF514]
MRTTSAESSVPAPTLVSPASTSTTGWRVLAAMAVVLVLWASAFIAIRYVGDAISPGPLALGRQLVGAAALISVAIIRRPPLPRGRTLALIALYGVLWFAGYTLVLNLAERHLDAGTAAMLVNIAPLLVALAAGAFLKEGFPRSLMIGMLVAFVGVVVIATGGVGAHSDPLGIALGILAAVLYALGVLVQKVALRTADALSATWVGCAIGAAVLLPFLPQAVGELAVAPAPAVWAMAYLGVFPTAIAFLLWAYVLKRTPAGLTASATLAVPAIVVLLSRLLLGELPTLLGMIGGALCLAGVAISRRSPRPPKA